MVFLCRSFDDYLLSSTFNPDLNANCEYSQLPIVQLGKTVEDSCYPGEQNKPV